MKKYLNFIGLMVMCAVIVTVSYLGFSRSSVLGSVTVGNEYLSTTTVVQLGSATSFYLVKAGPGTLGSVIIASTTDRSGFNLYDGTFSTTTATSTLTKLPRSSAAGTYTFDMTFKAGLIIEEEPGFNGIYTVTYRN